MPPRFLPLATGDALAGSGVKADGEAAVAADADAAAADEEATVAADADAALAVDEDAAAVPLAALPLPLLEPALPAAG